MLHTKPPILGITMFQRRVPVWLRHAPTRGVRGFALLGGIEATVRGTLVSVFPLVMYRAYQDAGTVSQIYLGVGVLSMAFGLMVPWLTRFLPRRWTFTLGALLFVLSAALAISGTPTATALALLCYATATVTVFVCFNAYVLDFIAQAELGRCETLRMFYSALAWTVGPAGGVWLLLWWEPAPFLVAACAACALLAAFWWMRLGNGRLIVRARAPAPNPLAFLVRFFRQPRLVAGWLFAVLRSCGWWVYVVYVPIFAVESGLGETVGGAVLSISNGMLFATPLMLRWVQRHSVRHALRVGFFMSGAAFVLATLCAGWPWPAIALLMAGTVFLVLLDITGGLPFLLAVKPSERTEMSAVYSCFRDVSGVLSPGVAWLVLLAAPISGIFAVAGAGLFCAYFIAGSLHPRLGADRTVRVPDPPSPLLPPAAGAAPQT